jgi:hypothetical protein
MKFLLSVVLIILLAFAFGLFLPWWSIALAGFVVSAFIPQRPATAFLAGFLSLVLLWGIIALARDTANDSILSKRVAGIMFQGESSFLLILATAIIGGIVGGLGALSGSLLRKGRSRNTKYEVEV